ncbi:MAG: tetratricopeptide repeat protein [Verrucomicrobiota bacterium]
MESLSRPDQLRLDAVEGWLMLGDAVSARAEFDQLSAGARLQPDVLECEWGLQAAANAWAEAFVVAERLVAVSPERAFGWIHRAFALRRMPGGGLDRAWAALRPAHDRFPKDFLIPFNLACYAAQLGRLDEAWEWLEKARAHGPAESVLRMVLADEDLRPLWPRLQESAGG